MILHNSYHPLIQSLDAEAKTLSSLIVKYVSVQAIFLLGSSKNYRKTSTIFSYDGLTAPVTSHYYILVLVEKEAEYSLNAVQDKIENNLQHFIPTTIIVLSTTTFLDCLGKGHPFEVNVLQKAKRLYQAKAVLFPSAESLSPSGFQPSEIFKQSKLKIESFLAGAELYAVRKEYRFSAFMLHQAAEQALRTMLLINTGLKINTHNIDKLLRYCSMFCSELPELFQNEKEKKLHSLLNKAYIDTRYKDDYFINYEELTALTQKVKMINQLFEQYKNEN